MKIARAAVRGKGPCKLQHDAGAPTNQVRERTTWGSFSRDPIGEFFGHMHLAAVQSRYASVFNRVKSGAQPIF